MPPLLEAPLLALGELELGEEVELPFFSSFFPEGDSQAAKINNSALEATAAFKTEARYCLRALMRFITKRSTIS